MNKQIAPKKSQMQNVAAFREWIYIMGLHSDEVSQQAERVGVVQPGEEKAPGRPYSPFQYLKGTYRRDGEGLFARACSDRTRGNGSN